MIGGLRIAQLAPLWSPVPPVGYGGAELTVHWLTEELVRRGHTVTLFASGDSRTTATLRPVCEHNIIGAMSRGEALMYEPYATAAFTDAIRQSDDFDIVHNHLGASMIPLGAVSPAPVVHTVHAGLSVDEHWLLARYPNAPLAALSRSHAAAIASARRDNVRVIYQSCDFTEYPLGDTPGDYVAFLSRMGPLKNPLGAIQLARAAGMPIRLAGRPQNADERQYFESRVRPLIDGRDVTYLGEISQHDKKRLLAGARALLFPILWDEHFGIVMVEAMACGTPVVACSRGSVPEVVDQGVTGYHGVSVDDLGSLIPAALALSRRRVREHAESRFSHLRMVDEYLDFYRAVIAGGHLSRR